MLFYLKFQYTLHACDFRLHNKGVYVKVGLRKMVSPKMCKDLHHKVELDVDGRSVDLPALEGIIVLNILR